MHKPFSTGVFDTCLCFPRSTILTVKQDECVKHINKSLFELASGHSDCEECLFLKQLDHELEIKMR